MKIAYDSDPQAERKRKQEQHLTAAVRWLAK
jgi:hypothetical protein